MLTRKEFLKFPINYFAVAMGFLGVSSQVSSLSNILDFNPYTFSLAISIIAWAVFAISIVIFTKNLFTTQGRSFLFEQWNCPYKLIDFSFLSLTLMLFLLSIYRFLPSEIMEVCGYVLMTLHILLNIEIFKRWIEESKVVIMEFKTVIFVLLSGNFMVVIAGHSFLPSYAMEILWFYFSISLLFWFVFLFFIIYRLIFSTNFPKELRPSLFILLSPPSLSIVAYQLLTEQNSLNDFMLIIFNFTLFLFIFLLLQYLYFKQIKINMLSWAYIFPVSSFDFAVQYMYKTSLIDGYLYLSFVVLAINVLFAIFLLIYMIISLYRAKE